MPFAGSKPRPPSISMLLTASTHHPIQPRNSSLPIFETSQSFLPSLLGKQSSPQASNLPSGCRSHSAESRTGRSREHLDEGCEKGRIEPLPTVAQLMPHEVQLNWERGAGFDIRCDPGWGSECLVFLTSLFSRQIDGAWIT